MDYGTMSYPVWTRRNAGAVPIVRRWPLVWQVDSGGMIQTVCPSPTRISALAATPALRPVRTARSSCPARTADVAWGTCAG
jgi:hypothetical protein